MMQPTMTMTTTAAGADAPNEKEELAAKILSMNAEELMLFIYLAERELGLQFD